MKQSKINEAELSRKLGYQFIQPNLLTLALMHRSIGSENNERLEFLGDSIVNMIIAEALFHQFPHAQEGELSRWRATLINRETLGVLAQQFNIGRYLYLGIGELKSGGRERKSILSCAMESIIGAIYMDGGFSVVREVILRWYHPLLLSLTQAADLKDPKTQLQEYLQGLHLPLPIYHVEAIEGEGHQQIFSISCVVQDKKILAKGTSRRRGEQEAAEHMLKALKK